MVRIAAIDLGTNTFHLLIVEKQDGKTKKLHDESLVAKLGKGGINQQIITYEATERALKVLRYFRQVIDNQQVSLKNVHATGTSAVRNAENKNEFIEKVFAETGIKIQEISGNEEAELIYFGVKEAMKIGQEISMIMDIGGGSVEFIICNDDRVFWKQSFEIGGQRLMERFMKSDPISMRSVQMMDDFFREKLLPLTNAVHQYSPKTLIGSSGSFDTLIDIFQAKNNTQLIGNQQVSHDLPIAEFYQTYENLLLKNHDERMAIAGMIELRVDMIVVAVCLIRFVRFERRFDAENFR
jgi:exopolyphosphatase / guanosine-5'-triphosphate,3'-diphosphate pyrophosphatase